MRKDNFLTELFLSLIIVFVLFFATVDLTFYFIPAVYLEIEEYLLSK